MSSIGGAENGACYSYSLTDGYRENVITFNGTGTVDGGTNLGDNFCEGTGVMSSTCP